MEVTFSNVSVNKTIDINITYSRKLLQFFFTSFLSVSTPIRYDELVGGDYSLKVAPFLYICSDIELKVSHGKLLSLLSWHFFLSPMQEVVFKLTVLYLRLIQIKVLSISMIVFQIRQQEYQSLPSKQSKPPGTMQPPSQFLLKLYFARDAFLEIHFCVILECIQKFLAPALPESRLGPFKGLKVCIRKTSKCI